MRRRCSSLSCSEPRGGNGQRQVLHQQRHDRAHRGLNLNALLQYPGFYFLFQTAALHCTRVGLATARAWWGGVYGRGWSFLFLVVFDASREARSNGPSLWYFHGA